MWEPQISLLVVLIVHVLVDIARYKYILIALRLSTSENHFRLPYKKIKEPTNEIRVLEPKRKQGYPCELKFKHFEVAWKYTPDLCLKTPQTTFINKVVHYSLRTPTSTYKDLRHVYNITSLA